MGRHDHVHVHASETRVDVVCESCQAPINVACSCAEGTLTSDRATSDRASETRVDVVCESCQAPVGVACTCADGVFT
jgi:hypothetical protein